MLDASAAVALLVLYVDAALPCAYPRYTPLATLYHCTFFALQVVASRLAMNKKKATILLQHVNVVNLSRKIFKLWLESARITSQSKKWFRVC